MGQLLLLHIWSSLTSPTQALPPCWGSGLLQTRVRCRTPPAQVTVQADHGDQGLHRPSTVGREQGLRQAVQGCQWGQEGQPSNPGSLTWQEKLAGSPFMARGRGLVEWMESQWFVFTSGRKSHTTLVSRSQGLVTRGCR